MANGILGRHPGRVLIVVIGVLAVINLAVFIGVVQDSSEPGTEMLPSSVESVHPAPGTQADRRITVTVDLLDGLTGVLEIDGQRLPEDQLDYVVPQGIISFQPGPDQALSSFEAGEHTVRVLYWKATEDEPADPDSYGWRFRATA
ncbi:MAG TPA: hypothetical protein VMQ81_02835 [Acidimicrobiia bacterium]|nr:hypothetical protein [Acidimicrobiia bacterium]